MDFNGLKEAEKVIIIRVVFNAYDSKETIFVKDDNVAKEIKKIGYEYLGRDLKIKIDSHQKGNFYYNIDETNFRY